MKLVELSMDGVGPVLLAQATFCGLKASSKRRTNGLLQLSIASDASSSLPKWLSDAVRLKQNNSVAFSRAGKLSLFNFGHTT